MLRIAACDDDEKERLRIAELLGRYREEKNAPFILTCTGAGWGFWRQGGRSLTTCCFWIF